MLVSTITTVKLMVYEINLHLPKSLPTPCCVSLAPLASLWTPPRDAWVLDDLWAHCSPAKRKPPCWGGARTHIVFSSFHEHAIAADPQIWDQTITHFSLHFSWVTFQWIQNRQKILTFWPVKSSPRPCPHPSPCREEEDVEPGRLLEPRLELQQIQP